MVHVYVERADDRLIHNTQLTVVPVNNRATLDWCLFERFDAESTENITSSSAAERCGKPCDPVRAAIDDRITANPSTYDFCEANGNITENSKSCLSCLYANEDLTILGNSTSPRMRLHHGKKANNAL
jgi:hypothetical protein